MASDNRTDANERGDNMAEDNADRSAENSAATSSKEKNEADLEVTGSPIAQSSVISYASRDPHVLSDAPQKELVPVNGNASASHPSVHERESPAISVKRWFEVPIANDIRDSFCLPPSGADVLPPNYGVSPFVSSGPALSTTMSYPLGRLALPLDGHNERSLSNTFPTHSGLQNPRWNYYSLPLGRSEGDFAYGEHMKGFQRYESTNPHENRLNIAFNTSLPSGRVGSIHDTALPASTLPPWMVLPPATVTHSHDSSYLRPYADIRRNNHVQDGSYHGPTAITSSSNSRERHETGISLMNFPNAHYEAPSGVERNENKSAESGLPNVQQKYSPSLEDMTRDQIVDVGSYGAPPIHENMAANILQRAGRLSLLKHLHQETHNDAPPASMFVSRHDLQPPNHSNDRINRNLPLSSASAVDTNSHNAVSLPTAGRPSQSSTVSHSPDHPLVRHDEDEAPHRPLLSAPQEIERSRDPASQTRPNLLRNYSTSRADFLEEEDVGYRSVGSVGRLSLNRERSRSQHSPPVNDEHHGTESGTVNSGRASPSESSQNRTRHAPSRASSPTRPDEEYEEGSGVEDADEYQMMCPVCNKYRATLMVVPCGHGMYCSTCIYSRLRRKQFYCPSRNCRKRTDVKGAIMKVHVVK